jgi:hypothetical protein
MLRRAPITEAERETLQRLRILALDEGFTSSGVRAERYRIAEWIEQTVDEGWLPVAGPGGGDVSATDDAKALLESSGYVVLREKSYRQAQERQRIAEAMREYAEELREGQDRWLRSEVLPRERFLADRLTFLYGVARAHGATVEELRGPDA